MTESIYFTFLIIIITTIIIKNKLFFKINIHFKVVTKLMAHNMSWVRPKYFSENNNIYKKVREIRKSGYLFYWIQ